MGQAKDRATRSIRKFKNQFEPRRIVLRGVLGHPDGSTVRVPERKDLVYVRLTAQGSALWKVLNDKVGDDWGLPVLLEKHLTGDFWEVIDVDKSALLNVGDGWSGEAYLQNHAWRHEWPDQVAGPDAVNVYPRSIVPLRSYSRSYGGLFIRVTPHRYTYEGALKTFWGSELDLSTYQPISGKARYVLTYVDPRDNILYANPGPITTYSSAIPITLPGMPPYAIPSALVRIWGDQNYIVENDIVDYRILLGVNVPDQAGGVKDASFVVMSYDPTLTNERQLQAGSGITITDEGAGGAVILNSVAGGAPSDAEYLVLTPDGTLTDERQFTTGDGLGATDGGAGSTYQVDVLLSELVEKASTSNDDIYLLEEAGGDILKQRYDTLMQEAFQRAWFYGE